jgi:hypothetical protein
MKEDFHMKKERFERAKMEIIELAADDVICTSADVICTSATTKGEYDIPSNGEGNLIWGAFGENNS